MRTPPALPTPAARPLKRSAPSAKIAARFRLRVTAGETIAVGPGKIALLEAIGETGSITAAAKQLEMSYRRAWMLLDELNRAMRKPAVSSANGGRQGGGSALTDAGRELIELYRQVEATAAQACKPELTRLIALLRR
jgi:molybdate transport system regulatory protein